MEENLIWKKVTPERVSRYELAFNVAVYYIENFREYFSYVIEEVKTTYGLTDDEEKALSKNVFEEMLMIQELSVDALFAIYDKCNKTSDIYYEVVYKDHNCRVPINLVTSTIINEIKRRVK